MARAAGSPTSGAPSAPSACRRAARCSCSLSSSCRLHSATVRVGTPPDGMLDPAARTVASPAATRSDDPFRSSVRTYSAWRTSATGSSEPPVGTAAPRAAARSRATELSGPSALESRKSTRYVNPTTPRPASSALANAPWPANGAASAARAVALLRGALRQPAGQRAAAAGEFEVAPTRELRGEVGDDPVRVARAAAAADHRAGVHEHPRRRRGVVGQLLEQRVVPPAAGWPPRLRPPRRSPARPAPPVMICSCRSGTAPTGATPRGTVRPARASSARDLPTGRRTRSA